MYFLSNLSYKLTSATKIELNETHLVGELVDALKIREGVETTEINWKTERTI